MNWQETIIAGTSPLLISNPEPEFGETITISFLVSKDNDIQSAVFYAINNSYCKGLEMKRRNFNDFFEQFYIEFEILNKFTNFYFLLRDKNNFVYFLSNSGITSYLPAYYEQFFLIRDPQYPSWLKNAIFYQIFPDRFYKSDDYSTDYSFEYDGFKSRILPWKKNIDPLSWQQAHNFDHFGGNLLGIIQKVDYLKNLGINAIYLNPIFLSPPNHKYHTEDYLSIDPFFGNKEIFIKLVKILHQNNIKIIIDGVFNHVGWYHRWFNRFKKYTDLGAYNSAKSKYSDYFIFLKLPDKYLAWADVKEIPILNYQNNDLKNEIFNVLQYWIKQANIDGWRFDVASNIGNYPKIGIEIGDQILTGFRKNIKNFGKDKLMLAELFHDAVRYLREGIFDSAMNYVGFANPVINFLSDKRFYILEPGWQYNFSQPQNRAQILSAELLQVRKVLNHPILSQMYNLLGSHDTPRLASLLKDKNKRLLALILQFTYIGIPAIYYGDEIGLDSGNDPTVREPLNRRIFIWDESAWDKHLLDNYKKLIQIRKKYISIFSSGLYKELYAKDGIFAFIRIAIDGQILVIVNGADKEADINLNISTLGFNGYEFKVLFYSGSFDLKPTKTELKLSLGQYTGLILLRDESF